MKNYFPADYCPQREKVVDLSRSVLGGNRKHATMRRRHGRYVQKADRRNSREQLGRAASWLCTCDGDPDLDCGRCQSDDMPTVSETRTGGNLPRHKGKWDRHGGRADTLDQLFRWCEARTAGMNHLEVEEFLRAQFLLSPFGHSLKTRHAYDHLIGRVRLHRESNYTECPELAVGSPISRDLAAGNFVVAA